MTEKITVIVNGHEVQVPQGATVMDACTKAEQEIPRFCYHERLSVAGNCRMCLVEVEGAPKPVASCHFPAADGMKVNTESETTKEARKGTMEFLLANHPLDCPICDQGGECDLQDIAVSYGSDRSRFNEMKRSVDDRDIGPLIKTVMTRCIHCTRCVRFATEVAGVEEFGATGRGENMEIGTYVERALESELAGNMIDLCPVGALTNKPYAYTARPWELQHTNGIDVMDACGSHISIDHRAGQVMRVTPRECNAINEEWIADTARFSWDGLATNRLTAPLVRKGKKLTETDWPTAFKAIKTALDKAKPQKIAGVLGNQQAAEDAFAFNAFMQHTLATANVDCRTDGSATDASQRALYTMGTPIEQLEQADAVLLIGCNPRLEAPMANLRLRKVVRNGSATVFNLGAPADLTYATTELGDNVQLLEALNDPKHKVFKALKKAENPVVIVGSGSLQRDDGAAIVNHAYKLAEAVDALRLDWNGFNIIQQHAGRVAALDMGVLPDKDGMSAADISSAAQQGQLDVLFVYGEGDMPPQQLTGAGLTVYIGTHRTTLAEQADVVLPAASYTEKTALWANAEGRVQESFKAVNPPLHAKEDWKIFRALSAEVAPADIGPLPFDSQAQLRELMAARHPAYAAIGQLVPATEAIKLSRASKLNSAPLQPTVQEFYRQNVITQHSAVMTECQKLANERTQPQQKAA